MDKIKLIRWSTTYFSPEGFEVEIAFEADSDSLPAVMAAGKQLLTEMKRKRVVPVRSRPMPPIGRSWE